MIPSNIDYRFINGLHPETDIDKLIEHAKANDSKKDGATHDDTDGGKQMIIISERPTTIGKLISLHPQFYRSPRVIAEALDREQPIEAKSNSKINKPQDCPVGTVAILDYIGNGTYYVMKANDGYWNQVTPPFQYFTEDIDEVDATTMLTVIYNPHDDK